MTFPKFFPYYMEFKKNEEFFCLNVLVNSSMLNSILDQLAMTIAKCFPSYISNEFSAEKLTHAKRIDSQEFVYISSELHRLAAHSACLKNQLTLMEADLAANKKKLLLSSLEPEISAISEMKMPIAASVFLLQSFVDSPPSAIAEHWNAWCDDRGYLYFQPTMTAQVAWLKVLYQQSCQDHQDLLFVESYSPVKMSWWYVGDRSQQLLRYLCADVAILDKNIFLLLESDSPVLRALILAIGDVWDALAQNWVRRCHVVGRQLVASFLAWERAVIFTEIQHESTQILLSILRLTVVEMLRRSIDR